jgi:hypothetical protein
MEGVGGSGECALVPIHVAGECNHAAAVKAGLAADALLIQASLIVPH